MITLERLFSEPEGLFEEVQFHKGINIIYGEKSENASGTDSLNSIGKSTLVLLINFCLLSSFDIRSKLYKAKSFLDEYYIVLELNVDGTKYVIKRSTKNQSNVIFGKLETLQEYPLPEVQGLITDLMFDDKLINCDYTNKWLRKLIPFFIRDEKTGFKSPVQYIAEMSRLEITIYNLFLLGIDGSFAIKNYENVKLIKKLQKTINQVKALITQTYGFKNINEVNSNINKMATEVIDLEQNISNYKLEKNYNVSEVELDNLTSKIKDLIVLNSLDKERIVEYKKTYERKIELDIEKVATIYKEISEELGVQVQKTLEDAIAFKKNLLLSRKKFLKQEIGRMEQAMVERDGQISSFDQRRSEIFAFLETKKAIKDLIEAFHNVNIKKDELNELKGKLKIHTDLQTELLDEKQAQATLEVEIAAFVLTIQEQIRNLQDMFIYIYTQIYTSKDDALFNISFKDGKTETKIDIKAETPDSDGWGKGRGCILIYDLTIMLNALEQKRKFPSFLIHDGVFNGIHKSHFVSTMNMLHLLSSECIFQYIFTANEDDTWLPKEKDSELGVLDFALGDVVVARYSENLKGKIFKRDY